MEWTTVETGDGAKLSVRLFKPPPADKAAAEDVAVVLVHPYSILGGVQGLLRGIAEGVARRGYAAVTFDMRGAGRSTGRASLTGSAEVLDVVAVCRWVAENIKPRGILLVGSSAGRFPCCEFLRWLLYLINQIVRLQISKLYLTKWNVPMTTHTVLV
jgi:uncharacterized protein